VLRALAVGTLLTAGCAGQLVPTEKMPLVWVHEGRQGHYEKGGYPVDGWTCGEQYRRAVAGNDAAEARIDSCRRYMTAYGVLMGTFALAIPTSIGVAVETDNRFARGTAVGVGIASFAVGLVMGYIGNRRLREAARIYNSGVESGVEPAP
jgi:hypothetical protein